MIVLTAFRDGRLTGRIEAGEDKAVTIGRSSDNAFVLEGDAVSREHCRVSFESGAWILADAGSKGGVFVGGVRLTGPRPLADGEAFDVADYHVVARLAGADGAAADRTEFQPRAAAAGEGPNKLEIISGPGQGAARRFSNRIQVGRSTRSDLVIDDPTVSREHLLIELRGDQYIAVNQNPRNSVLINGAPLQTGAVAHGDVLTIGPAQLRLSLEKGAGRAAGSGLAGRLTRRPKLLAAAGAALFVIVAGAFFMSSPSPSSHEAVIEGERAKESEMQDAELARKTSTLFMQARRLADEGQDEQALTRLTALFEIDSGNEEAKGLETEIKDRMAAQAAEAEARRMAAEKNREAAAPHLAESERLLARNDLAAARQALDKAKAASPDLPDIAELAARITQAEDAVRRAHEEQAQAALKEREQLAGAYEEAAAALKADDGYKALTLYRKLGEEEIDPARAEAARKKAALIQDALVKRVMPDFTLGQKLYSQKKYGEAFKVYVRILEVYPEAKETKARVEELAPMLEGEARRLYEEGLVYQGLGNMETARERWREVLATMPLPDNEYYRRAQARLSGVALPGSVQ